MRQRIFSRCSRSLIAAAIAATCLVAGCDKQSATYFVAWLFVAFGAGAAGDVSREQSVVVTGTYQGSTLTLTINNSLNVGTQTLTVPDPITGVTFFTQRFDPVRNWPDVLVTTARRLYLIRKDSVRNIYLNPTLVDDAGENSQYVSERVQLTDINGDYDPDIVFATRGADNGVYVRVYDRLNSRFAGRSGISSTPAFTSEAITRFFRNYSSAGMVLSAGGTLYVMRSNGVDRMEFVNANTGMPTQVPSEAAVQVFNGNPGCTITKINAGSTDPSTVTIPVPIGCAPCVVIVYAVGPDGRLFRTNCVGSLDDQPIDDVAPADVLLEDLTNDGIPDLVLARPDRNEVGIRLGLPAGGFGPERAFPIPGIDSLRSKLLDDDDYPDILAGSTANNSTTYLFNDRNGGVYSRSNRPGRTTPYSLAVADFDGDGYADALTRGPNLANAWSLYRGGPNTPGDFSQTPINLPNTGAFPALDIPVVAYKPPSSVSAARRLAYVDSVQYNKILLASISVSNGIGAFTPLPSINLGMLISSPARDLVAADLDGDGDDDLVIPAISGSAPTDTKVWVFYQNADGSFAAPTPLRFNAFGNTYWARVGKFVPGAGRDIVTQRGVLRNDGAGVFTDITNANSTVAGLFAPIAIGDLDGDGTDDVIGYSQNLGTPPQFTTLLFLNNGAGDFLPRQAILTTPAKPEQITVDTSPSATGGPGAVILSITFPTSSGFFADRIRQQVVVSSNGPLTSPTFSLIPSSQNLGPNQAYCIPVSISTPGFQVFGASDAAPATRTALVVASQDNGPYGGLSVYPSIGAAIAPCIGDATRDRRIDFFDLNTVLAFYGTSQPIGKNGDVSYDGAVNFDDLNLVLSRYGSACSP